MDRLKKYMLQALLLFSCLAGSAQSPYLSISLKMDSAQAKVNRYKIEMKICELRNMTERGDWFTPDSSKIDFTLLKPADISCGEYIETEKKDEGSAFNQFKFGNQVFAWEKILVFKLSVASPGSRLPEMYIVLPVKHKAFASFILLNGIEFQSGKLMFITDLPISYRNSSLSVTSSLSGYKTTEVKDSPLQVLLEE